MMKCLLQSLREQIKSAIEQKCNIYKKKRKQKDYQPDRRYMQYAGQLSEWNISCAVSMKMWKIHCWMCGIEPHRE